MGKDMSLYFPFIVTGKQNRTDRQILTVEFKVMQ